MTEKGRRYDGVSPLRTEFPIRAQPVRIAGPSRGVGLPIRRCPRAGVRSRSWPGVLVMSGGGAINVNASELLQAVALILALFAAFCLVSMALLVGWVEVRKAISDRARSRRTPPLPPSSRVSSSDGARGASRPHDNGDRS